MYKQKYIKYKTKYMNLLAEGGALDDNSLEIKLFEKMKNLKIDALEKNDIIKYLNINKIWNENGIEKLDEIYNYKKELTEFYKKNNPEKLKNKEFIWNTLIRFVGREKNLLNELALKYPEPQDEKPEEFTQLNHTITIFNGNIVINVTGTEIEFKIVTGKEFVVENETLINKQQIKFTGLGNVKYKYYKSRNDNLIFDIYPEMNWSPIRFTFKPDKKNIFVKQIVSKTDEYTTIDPKDEKPEEYTQLNRDIKLFDGNMEINVTDTKIEFKTDTKKFTGKGLDENQKKIIIGNQKLKYKYYRTPQNNFIFDVESDVDGYSRPRFKYKPNKNIIYFTERNMIETTDDSNDSETDTYKINEKDYLCEEPFDIEKDKDKLTNYMYYTLKDNKGSNPMTWEKLNEQLKGKTQGKIYEIKLCEELNQ